MSHVASVILVTSGVEHDYTNRGYLVDRLNAYLRLQYRGREFVQVDQHAGGDKGFQNNVYLVAINYLNIERFLRVFRAIPWQLPEMVQLFIRDEHDDDFTVYRPECGITTKT